MPITLFLFDCASMPSFLFETSETEEGVPSGREVCLDLP